MGHAKGCLNSFLVILAISLVVQLGILTWPVCVPAAIAGAGWFFTGKSKKLALTAIHKLLGPVTIGLLVVAALVLSFDQISEPAGIVGYTERALVFADNKLPTWTKFTPLRFILTLLGLTALAYWHAQLKAVTRFFQFKSYLSRGTAILGAATSFTFFTNVAVIQPRLPAIYQKIEAVYRHSKEGQQKAVDRFLAARAVQRALATPGSSTLESCNALVSGVANAPLMDTATQRVLAAYTAVDLHQKAGLSGDFQEAAAASLPHESALNALDEQLVTEKAANSFADEAVKAAKESINFGNDALKEVGWSFLDGLIGEQAGQVSRLAKPLVDKILDKYFEYFAEPMIEMKAKSIQELFHRWETSFATPQAAARNEVQSAMALMSEREAELARNAAHEATQAARTAKSASDAGDTRAADKALRDAEEASVRATKNADLAKSATRSLSKLTDVFPAASSTQTQVAIAAAGAAEAAKAMRAAVEVEDAIRAAKSAAQALEDAKAVQSAAEAAEAAKTLLRVIPK